MSVQSSFFYLLLRIINYRARTQRQFLAEAETGIHPGHTAEFRPSKRLAKACHVETSEISGQPVLTIRPKSNANDQFILFFHGGAYLRNAVKPHWDFVYLLVQQFGYTVVFPDYPLAPANGYQEVHGMIEACYQEMVAKHNPGKVILMGDSAGGGLALVLAQKLRDSTVKQPGHIILLSPWLDLSLTNPGIPEIEKKDALLLVKGLKAAGVAYAKDLSTRNPLVSPIYGDFLRLGKISVFTGTFDILFADARKFKGMCDQQGIEINYHEYPAMIHDWMILGFPESQQVLEQIDQILKAGVGTDSSN
jgi:acetyl esterase/lipase